MVVGVRKKHSALLHLSSSSRNISTLKSIGFILLFLLTLFFSSPYILHSAETFHTQVGAFSLKKNAYYLVDELTTIGITCSVYEIEGLYKVYCGEFSQKSDAYALKGKMASLGYEKTFVVSKTQPPQDTKKLESLPTLALPRDFTPPPQEKTENKYQVSLQQKVSQPADRTDMFIAKEIVTLPIERGNIKDMAAQEVGKYSATVAQDTQENESEPKDVPQGTISGNIFERRGGYFHPFLSIEGYYTDNVFNTKDDKKHDYIAILSPGIWITIPRIKQQLSAVETSPISPGGFKLSRIRPEYFRRVQTYLLYRADIEQFSKYSSENTINQIAEGLLQYNFKGGFSLELINQFVRSHDIRGTGISRELDKFRTNFFNALLTYDAGKRVSLRADYSHFLVNYEASRNDFRDHADSSVSGYVFYKILPKTKTFVQYRYIDVAYDDPILLNSKEHHFFGGLQWDITAKSRGHVKAGYGIKDMDDSETESKNFILEVQMDHNFTPKTSLSFTASRKTNETNISTTDFMLSNSIGLKYRQKFTSRITGVVNFSYINDQYRGDLTFGGVTKEREDDYYDAGVAFQYELIDWLKIDTGYRYSRRESSFSDFDYTNNTLLLRITGSL